MIAQEAGIAERIEALDDYGPIKIKTRTQDIPGAEYRVPYRAGNEGPPFTFIGSSALSLIHDEEGLGIVVQVTDEAEEVILRPDQIEGVEVDHPFGHFMPLNGEDMMAIGVTDYDGVDVLRWPDHVIEYGWGIRIETEEHPRFPGISIVKTYRADKEITTDIGAKHPSLEEAKEKDKNPGIYLITRLDDECFIVTSRIGFKKTRPVFIRRPNDKKDLELMQIEMLDMHRGATDEELLEKHLDRYKFARRPGTSSTPNWPLTPFESDGVFLYMVSD